MIELKCISAGYEKKPILRNISTSLENGRLTAIVGVNGSGKTTLLKTVAGIIPPIGGEVYVDGTAVGGLSSTMRAKRIAYLPQGRDLPDMTAGQLVLHGRFPHLSFPRAYSDNDRAIAADAMAEMEISHLSAIPLSGLSGGMRQKVYIAMALAQGSDYILLDEPTTYLDIAHRISLMHTLSKLAEGGKGVIAVLHDLSLAMEFAHEIILLSDGEIKLKETPDKLFDSGLIETAFGVSVTRTETNDGWTYIFGK